MHEREEGSYPSEFHNAKRLSRDMRMFLLVPRYAKIVQQCIDCNFGQGEDNLNNPQIREVFYQNVVRVLAELEEGFHKWRFGT